MRALLSEIDVSAGEVTYPPGGTLGPRRQDDLQLVLVHRGSASIAIDDEPPFVVGAETVALLLPGHRETFAFDERRETHHSWIQAHVDEPPGALPRSLPLSTALADLDLARLAAAALVSPPHLVRRFRAELDTTPMAYLWRRRVAHGVDLLTHTGLPVGEIASRCGFKTVYHFSRRVREQTGSAPTQLRQARWRV